jgi:ABC-2 type transport system ATP-binding protein
MTDGPTARSHDVNPHDVDDVAIRSRGLAKRHGDRWTVDHLDLDVPTGALSGFVGPNGAGKSTTLRLLLGLVRPTEGRATVLGQPLGSARTLPPPGRRDDRGTDVPPGSDRPRQPHAARDVAAPARRRIHEVLEQIGMADRADAPYATYSLGMKQRLGIAAALLPKPDLLILDEPTNGLDPAGIREVRSLLKELAGGGMTVFVSSHLLSEVEQICDHLVMIRNGRLLFQGHVTELLAIGGSRIVLCPEHPCDTARLTGLIRDAGLRADVAPAVQGARGEASGYPGRLRRTGCTRCTGHRR